jgi:SAM-dependent methyltransferase
MASTDFSRADTGELLAATATALEIHHTRRERALTRTGETVSGSAGIQGRLWGARARDFTAVEQKMVALYESALDEVEIGSGTRLLDVGCGPGLFLRLAAQRGATVAGIDAAAPFIEIARERVPDADLTVGEMESLPYADDAFDVVTGFNAFQFAADPARALREAGRVAQPDAPIVIATWGRPDQCEAAAYVKSVGGLLPPPPPGAPGPFALSEPGALEEFAARGGLTAGERREVVCVWSFADEETLLRALKSTGFAVRASEGAGDERVTEAILDAVSPFRTSDGGCRLENVFTYLVAGAPNGKN